MGSKTVEQFHVHAVCLAPAAERQPTTRARVASRAEQRALVLKPYLLLPKCISQVLCTARFSIQYCHTPSTPAAPPASVSLSLHA